ncbi:hypothetical protein CNE_BB1p01750 (plasmid) [Cupriavidus necator N-1]|jgi:mRNA interferase MazF|uniref:Uncharacterized protein n=1 Tax=Cupriavidus necator (strain ATCC 43291 / DSM 13513 / CCUG 52238 / LMG 8453 / N-1) TaxID=1042878 RepID=F8GVW0_CUPNN|nr:hypothetical protein CNE_BB1p01750 [Cupriavidus necator N-1]KAI3597529.1 Programmed cell death toxin MazF [Cupriavidus necator H850]
MAGKLWVPERRDIIWIDCNPQGGRETWRQAPLEVFAAACEQLNQIIAIAE